MDSGEGGTYDSNNWTCSCATFKYSCYFLCNHLVKACETQIKYHTSIKLQDSWPFLKFMQLVGSQESDLSPIQFLLEPNTAPCIDIESQDEENDESYLKINSLVNFLSSHLQLIKENQNQLKALQRSLKSAFRYMNDIEEVSNSKEIPRTWKDTNENTLYYL